MAGRAVASQAVRTPRTPVLAAAATMAVSAALAVTGLLGHQLDLWVAVAGYLLGAVLAAALVQVHRAGRNRASSSPWFNPEPALDRLAALTLVAALVSGTWHAYLVATELAK